MTECLDRFTNAFLLSSYGFNDYRSKSSLNSDLDDSLEMDDHGKRLDAVIQGNSDGVAGYESDFHGVVGDVWVDFHSAPPPLTLNLGPRQDPNRSIHGIVDNVRVDFHGTPPPLISHVGLGDTSFHASRALGGVDSRLPSVSSGAHGLVDSGAYGLVLGAACVSHANTDIHANVHSHDAAIKDSHVSFKVINSYPLTSDQGLSFVASKNKGVNLNSLKKVVNIAGGFKKVQDSIKKVKDFRAPSFAQVANSTST
ncbi:hypothetical protein PanWU01x14_352030 [Parasponia andersonii]|uniref:Uncharacterized protein n=1 Tax=Parasponia andersonii TaxID=3476 RepID=A0A2P5AAH5_PARAD|nr:hypothetical protein PanWU01x14_352030 [Parasponia andersonii]